MLIFFTLLNLQDIGQLFIFADRVITGNFDIKHGVFFGFIFAAEHGIDVIAGFGALLGRTVADERFLAVFVDGINLDLETGSQLGHPILVLLGKRLFLLLLGPAFRIGNFFQFVKFLLIGGQVQNFLVAAVAALYRQGNSAV